MNSNYLVTFLFCFISLEYIECQIFCDDNTKCGDNGICNKELGLCECKDGLIYNTEHTKCLPVTSTPTYTCEDDRQCQAIIPGDVECQRGFCACRPGYQYSKNRCMVASILGEACNTDDECNHGGLGPHTVACIDKICTCASGYYKRRDTDCRKIGKVGEFCLLELDCDTMLFCNMTTMACEKKPISMHMDNSFNKESSDRNIKLASSVQLDTNTKKKVGRHTIIKTDQKLENANESNKDSKVRLLRSPDASDLTEKCSKTTKCTTKGAFCSLAYQTCVCNKDPIYDPRTSSCISALGGQCKGDEECISNSHCVNNMCVCKDRYYYGDLGQKCFKPARRLGDSCLHDRNCLTFGPNGAAVCIASACRCGVGYKYDNVNSLCVKAGGDGNICIMDEDCAARRNTHCDAKSQRCVCNEHYHPLPDETCMPDLGAPCSDGTCDGLHVECRAGLCQCEKNYGPEEEKCWKYVENLEENCEADVQCKDLLHEGGTCQEGHCVCGSGYTFINMTTTGKPDCLVRKLLGDMCSKVSDCRVAVKEEKLMICQNSICTCAPGAHATKDSTGCRNGTGKTIISSVLFALMLIATLHY